MPATAVILNADDLGLGPSVDDGIYEAWAAGAISDCSVFANAPELAALLARARDAGLPVGVHLNLTFGRPLCEPAEIPALVTPAGAFMKRHDWARPLPTAQVLRELTRQLDRVLALGGNPSHLDTHHHVHAYPEVLAAVIALARQHALPARAVSEEMRAALRGTGVAAPDDFSMAFYGARATVETLIALVASCPAGTLEIMTHPGHAGERIPSSYQGEREQELAVLTDPRWRLYLQERDIPLVSYAALRQPPDAR